MKEKSIALFCKLPQIQSFFRVSQHALVPRSKSLLPTAKSCHCNCNKQGNDVSRHQFLHKSQGKCFVKNIEKCPFHLSGQTLQKKQIKLKKSHSLAIQKISKKSRFATTLIKVQKDLVSPEQAQQSYQSYLEQQSVQQISKIDSRAESIKISSKHSKKDLTFENKNTTKLRKRVSKRKTKAAINWNSDQIQRLQQQSIDVIYLIKTICQQAIAESNGEGQLKDDTFNQLVAKILDSDKPSNGLLQSVLQNDSRIEVQNNQISDEVMAKQFQKFDSIINEFEANKFKQGIHSLKHLGVNEIPHLEQFSFFKSFKNIFAVQPKDKEGTGLGLGGQKRVNLTLSGLQNLFGIGQKINTLMAVPAKLKGVLFKLMRKLAQNIQSVQKKIDAAISLGDVLQNSISKQDFNAFRQKMQMVTNAKKRTFDSKLMHLSKKKIVKQKLQNLANSSIKKQREKKVQGGSKLEGISAIPSVKRAKLNNGQPQIGKAIFEKSKSQAKVIYNTIYANFNKNSDSRGAEANFTGKRSLAEIKTFLINFFNQNKNQECFNEISREFQEKMSKMNNLKEKYSYQTLFNFQRSRLDFIQRGGVSEDQDFYYPFQSLSIDFEDEQYQGFVEKSRLYRSKYWQNIKELNCQPRKKYFSTIRQKLRDEFCNLQQKQYSSSFKIERMRQ